jgi:rubredoxin
MNAQRHDDCPDCGARRTELVVVPGRFYCPTCGVAGPGPHEVVGAQLALEVGS